MRRVRTPLCHFVTSPPQGGRLVACCTDQPQTDIVSAKTEGHRVDQGSCKFPTISPLVGEMSRQRQRGVPAARHTRHFLLLLCIILLALLPLPAFAASKADVEAQFQAWIQKDL